MIYGILLSFYLAHASQVMMIDPSGSFFDPEDRSEKSLSQIADLVSRSFYLGALDENTDVSSLKLPMMTPKENLQITMFGVDPAKLSSLYGVVSEAVPLRIGEGAGFAASKLANHLYQAHPNAKVTTVSASRRIAELYNVQHRATVSSIEYRIGGRDQDTDVFGDLMESEFWQTVDASGFDMDIPEVTKFIQEMDLFLKAAAKFGSGSQEAPAFFYLTLDSFTALPEYVQEGPALELLDRVLGEILSNQPNQAIGQLVFCDSKNILTNVHLDQTFSRRRLASNSTSSNVTYEELYEYQIFYWFLVGAAFVIYFFVYCFAFMNYSNDQMLYTSFDASYKKDI